jgi:hypothetical protein
MKNFTTENETNNITVHGSANEAEAFPDSERFGTEPGLAKLAANCPQHGWSTSGTASRERPR